MAKLTKISWADATLNPMVGCRPVSAECVHCYVPRILSQMKPELVTARGYDKVFRQETKITEGNRVNHPQWTGVTMTQFKELEKLFEWKNPLWVFLGSMTDIFFERYTKSEIDEVLGACLACKIHKVLVLTKRVSRAVSYFTDPELLTRLQPIVDRWQEKARENQASLFDSPQEPLLAYPFPNLYFGFSAGNQQYFDERWGEAKNLRGLFRVMFCSAEPLLDRIDLKDSDLDQVITGGESGPKEIVRVSFTDWFRFLRDQCAERGIAFNFKQWGAYVPEGQSYPILTPDEENRTRQIACPNPNSILQFPSFHPEWNSIPRTIFFPVGKIRAGKRLDGIEYDQYPEERI